MTAYTCASYLNARFRLAARLLEFAAGLTKGESQIEAARITSALAMDLRYPWISLREALTDHPELAAQVPDKHGPVDALPWGNPSFAVRGGELVSLRSIGPEELIFPGPPP